MFHHMAWSFHKNNKLKWNLVKESLYNWDNITIEVIGLINVMQSKSISLNLPLEITFDNIFGGVWLGLVMNHCYLLQCSL